MDAARGRHTPAQPCRDGRLPLPPASGQRLAYHRMVVELGAVPYWYRGGGRLPTVLEYGSGADEAGDGRRRLLQLRVGLLTASGDGVDHTVVQVLVQQS
jgi:hypothetical protein